ncbi:MAG: hypothetical protein JNK90_21165 [Planctomycetaceae bacterium]|nr:hypothetical protein [Planctomycetaceae bacterium]
MIDRENLNREKHENREIGKEPALDQYTYKTAAKKWLNAVSSQVMVRLVTNIAT